MRKRELLSIYASGMCELVLTALGFSVIALIGLQLLAGLTSAQLDANGALLLLWQMIILMALWPGQRFWTIRRTTASGREHSLIGIPSDDDLRCMNHIAARRSARH